MIATPMPRPGQIAVVHAERLAQHDGRNRRPGRVGAIRQHNPDDVCDQGDDDFHDAADQTQQAAQQPVRLDDRVRRNRQHEILVGDVPEILTVNDGRQRVERIVFRKNLVAVGGQALPQREPAARADANDDALRFGTALIEDAAQRGIESIAMVHDALAGGIDHGLRRGDDRREQHESERETSKRSCHIPGSHSISNIQRVSYKKTSRARR